MIPNKFSLFDFEFHFARNFVRLGIPAFKFQIYVCKFSWIRLHRLISQSLGELFLFQSFLFLLLLFFFYLSDSSFRCANCPTSEATPIWKSAEKPGVARTDSAHVPATLLMTKKRHTKKMRLEVERVRGDYILEKQLSGVFRKVFEGDKNLKLSVTTRRSLFVTTGSRRNEKARRWREIRNSWAGTRCCENPEKWMLFGILIKNTQDNIIMCTMALLILLLLLVGKKSQRFHWHSIRVCVWAFSQNQHKSFRLQMNWVKGDALLRSSSESYNSFFFFLYLLFSRSLSPLHKLSQPSALQ